LTIKSKRKLMFTTAILAILLLSSVYAAFMPEANAAEITVHEKGLAISKDVVGLDTTKYAVNAKEYAQESYREVLPQETVRFNIESDGSNIEMLYTFVNGKLLMLQVLENEGSPRLTKTVDDAAEMAKDFLSSYQSYSGNSLYGELKSSLVGVDANSNSTKTVGNTKLEVSALRNNFTDRQIFRWTYTFNGVEAPDKVVALGYEDGFLGYFYDSWDLYKIGSTEVNVSEEQAIASAMERARNYSWVIEENNNTAIVKGFNVTGAMMWETVFRSSLVADEARNEDQLMLYPMRHVWVSLDKFYPGYVYGFNVYVWADTGEIARIHERICTQDPPSELVASADDYIVTTLNNQASFDDSAAVSAAELNSGIPSITLIALSVFGIVVMLGILKTVLTRKKGLSMRRFSKIGGILLCILTLSMLTVTITTVSAVSQEGRATIWTSRSMDSYNYTIQSSWRKHYNEVYEQQETAASIASSFNSNDYYTSNYQGNITYGDKSKILACISQNEALYPRVAVVYFDHGVGYTGIGGLPGNEFHFLSEDDAGTRSGQMHPGTGPHDEHAVFDMDIYPRTALGKIFFAFINTCHSAYAANSLGGYTTTQGIIPGTYRARSMPFAYTHLRPNIDMSSQGYFTKYPDDFCYIGFDGGSAALQQPIDGSCPDYYQWVEDFFGYALTYDVAVCDALDAASTIFWSGYEWWETPLYQGFNATWPMYRTQDGEEQWFNDTAGGQMAVYGSGGIHLYQKGGIWHLDGNANDSLHDNDGDIYGATSTTGKFSSALSFDGSTGDYVEMDTFDYDFTEITAEFWMKTSDTTKTGTPISCAQNAANQYNEFLLYNYKSFDIHINNNYVSTGVSANDGKWHHIAVTWKSSDGSVKLYKDGTQVYSGTLQSEATIHCDNLILGQEQDSFGGGFDSNQAFKGDIDEVRIYDYALSSSQIADNAAIASLHFNGGDYAYDSSLYENTGTVHGAEWDTGLWVSNGFSYGLSFDGSDDYVETYPFDYDFTEITAEFWMKTSDTTKTGTPISCSSGSQHNEFLLYNYKSFEIYVKGSQVSTGVSANDGKWHHIAVTWRKSDGQVKLYKDGTSVYTGTLQSGATINLANLVIGQEQDSFRGGFDSSQAFKGIIDEVRIYDRVLSPTEISNYYDANKPIHWLTVSAIWDQYGATMYPWVKIDGQTTNIASVTRGTHTVEVEGSIWDPYLGDFYFDRFTYDSTTNYNNPMTMSVSKDTEVIAHYYWNGW
jgi:hypothetical protein